MRKCAICPICEAPVFVEDQIKYPRRVLEYHLHYQEGQTWARARKMARSSTVILEDDHGNEIQRDAGGSGDPQDLVRNARKNREAPGPARDRDSPEQSSLQSGMPVLHKDKYAGIPRNLWEYLD